MQLGRRRAVLPLLLLLGACGRVGDVQPPFIRIPEPVKDLAVVQSGYELILSWTNPPRYIDGSAATNLARVQIRSEGASIDTVEVTAAGQSQSYPTPVRPGSDGARSFTVIVETTQGKVSTVSNTASITPVEVPGRVGGLTGFADQRRIFLHWDKPRDHPELADAYMITRADIPSEVQTVMDPMYEDSRYQQGQTFTYQVTPARRVAGTLVTGVGPETIMVTAEDKTPPSPPRGLDIAAADSGAVLTWDPNMETDVVGYLVFRSDRPDGGFKALNDRPITANSFFDPSYLPGHYYAVLAIDESGNKSAISAPFRRP